jgi:hypothetical protein
MNLKQTYERFFELTGSPEAAATLVLSETLGQTRRSRMRSADPLMDTVNEPIEHLSLEFNIPVKYLEAYCVAGLLPHKRVGRDRRIRAKRLDMLTMLANYGSPGLS